GNPEVIMYRKYESGKVTHSLHTYISVEKQTGVSKDLIDSYLMEDGLPISLSSLYKGDKTIKEVRDNRDPRMLATISNELHLSGLKSSYSSTGYVAQKFLNEDLTNKPEGTNSNF